MSTADPGADDVARLRRFWDARYRSFALAESGWSGAGEQFNSYVYRCKTSAVVRALSACRVTPVSKFNVLDAGCGQGFFASFYQHRYPRATYVGVDISERLIAHLRATRPTLELHNADLSSWTPPDGRQFDVIQCLEVVHLLLDDALVERAFDNFHRLLTPSGLLLVTIRPGEDDVRPGHYMHFRPESRMRAWWTRSGLVERLRVPIYYWMPDQGPAWRVTQPLFFRLPAVMLFAADRLALRLNLPRVRTGPDSKTQLVVLTRFDHAGASR